MMNPFQSSLKNFQTAFDNPDFSKESDYIIHDFEHALEFSNAFVRKDTRVEERVVISKLEWVGDGKSLSDLYKDFWCLYGHFAEREQFISTVLSKDSVTFIIICGNSQNNPHGHLLRIQVVGSSVKKSIEKIHVANAEQSVKSK